MEKSGLFSIFRLQTKNPYGIVIAGKGNEGLRGPRYRPHSLNSALPLVQHASRKLTMAAKKKKAKKKSK
jgi:hypothetical protein